MRTVASPVLLIQIIRSKERCTKIIFNYHHLEIRRKQMGNFYSEAVADQRTKITKKNNFAEAQLTKVS